MVKALGVVRRAGLFILRRLALRAPRIRVRVGFCLRGARVVVFASVATLAAASLAVPSVAGAYVYWTNFESGTIGRANLDGTSPDQSLIAGTSTPNGVVLDGSSLYWANQGAGGAGSGSIGQANLDGTSADESLITGTSDPAGVAVDQLGATTTLVGCTPVSVGLGHATTCTATVANTDGVTPTTPGGSVSFTDNIAGGLFSGTGSCVLSNGSCAVSYTPSAAGSQQITATYRGDGTHASSSASITETVLTAAQNTAAPAIIGAAKAGKTLTCTSGTWTNSPGEYLYQWSRDRTPIAGAASSSYKVQPIDEGNTLTCTVTAVNVAGSGSPATSTGAKVSVPFVRRCPAASGRLSGSKLGPVKLGDTKAQAEKAFTHSSNRGQRYEQFFCLTPIGIRVGYPSAKALAVLPARQRATLAGRVIWISTSSAYYAIDGIRPGASTTAATAKLKLGKVFHIGLNDWYLAPDGPATAILKVRHNIVQEIGIADKQLTEARTEQRTFLTSFS